MNNRYIDHLPTSGFHPCSRVWSIVLACLCMILALSACSGGGGGGGNATNLTISGTVFAGAGNVIDADVRDPNTVNGDNDGFAGAQAITSPAVVGGHVSSSSDPDDFYQVFLASGESVRLSVADDALGNIQLQLYDSGQTPFGPAVDVVNTELVDISLTDTYFIQVTALSGSSSYRLMFGDDAAITASDVGLSMAHEFVSGQALVRWKADVAPADGDRRLAMRAQAPEGGQRFHVMNFDTEDQVAAVYGQLGMEADRMAAFRLPDAGTEMQRKYDTLQIVRTLRQRDDVEIAEPNYIRRARLVPNDLRFDEQWHYTNINLPEAWDITTGDPTVIVAVIDSGVLVDHPDFAGQLVDGYDFISSPTDARDGDGPDADPDDPGDGLNNDSSFHGTHVAGTVAAAWNNALGVAGAGGQTRIMPVRVLGVGGGTDVDIIAGIRFAAGLNPQGALPAQPADIINMSLGGSAPSALLDAAIEDARAQGVIIVASAGNTPSNEPEYPASSPGVIGVAATDLNNKRTVYTSFGATIDVAAPGGDLGVDLDASGNDDGVLSTIGSDATGTIEFDYGYAQGTSMSAPHISGVAALMKAVRPGLTPDEMDAYLATGAITTDINDSGLGAGLIDAEAAVLAALAGPPATVLKAAPNTLNFESGTTAAILVLSKLGIDPLTVTSVERADPGDTWLNIAARTVDGDGLGNYLVTMDRSALPDAEGGLYTGTIAIISSANTIQVPVRLEVLPDRDADAGRQFILVLDATTFNLVDKQPMTFSPGSGVYTFSVTGLDAGSYFLRTGTDIDNDDLSLDAGEAFGAYPSSNQQDSLSVNSDISGISFTSGFPRMPIVTDNQLR